jgi:hypothetical protein
MHCVVNDSVVVYARMSSCCSACALKSATKLEVEETVNNQLNSHVKPYSVIDVSTFRDRPSSPNPCNLYPDTRQHWFLIKRAAYR